METRTVMYGKNGVPFTYIKYAPTPLENIMNIGLREKSRKAIEEKQNKISYVKELESRKRTEEIVKKLEEDFGSKSNLSKKQND